MKLKARFLRALTADNGDIELTFATSDRDGSKELKTLKDAELSLNIGKAKESRTMDANAYFWVLAGKVANALSVRGSRPMTAQEVYRQYIRDIGVYTVVPIKDDQRTIEAFKKAWTRNGLGWLIDDLGASRIAGYVNLKCHYGSSAYDKEQMSRLIDMVKADCDELGIETKTPDELEELKSLWGEAQ